MAFREYFEQLNHNTLRNFIYTPLSEAIKIQERRQQQQLKIESPSIPKPLFQKRTAVICRQVATPNHEMQRVTELADQHDLNLVIFTYNQDKFSSANYYKRSLGKMGFYQGKDKKGSKIVSFKTILDFNLFDGEALHICKTLRDKPLVDFHQQLLLQEFPQLSSENFYELEPWFLENGLSLNNH